LVKPFAVSQNWLPGKGRCPRRPPRHVGGTGFKSPESRAGRPAQEVPSKPGRQTNRACSRANFRPAGISHSSPWARWSPARFAARTLSELPISTHGPMWSNRILAPFLADKIDKGSRPGKTDPYSPPGSGYCPPCPRIRLFSHLPRPPFRCPCSMPGLLTAVRVCWCFSDVTIGSRPTTRTQ